MSKEIKYQNEAQAFIETQSESYSGRHIPIYTEEHSEEFKSILQECSPLIGGNSASTQYAELKSTYGIVGLREKIHEFNKDDIETFLAKNKRTESVMAIVEIMFQDFMTKYTQTTTEADLYQLIFATLNECNSQFKRQIYLHGTKDPVTYNVVYYEDPNNYLGKNTFYTIRERRIPIKHHHHKKTERPDFVHYINGIPLINMEYKTEDSGILESLKDFEYKESYRTAPFKLALNDGRDVIFFSDFQALKFANRKDTSFKWVHYLPTKKYVGVREFNNLEYLLDELVCQPQNLYFYCMDCCSAVNDGAKSYLINARIQQYYAIKDIRNSLVRVSNSTLPLPYNFEFAHAQRSGKTITMKLITYMIEKSFKNVFNTIFMYVPDLQIKDVIKQEFSKSGNQQVSIMIVETRADYQKIVELLVSEEKQKKTSSIVRIYIVNMQKITDDDLLLSNKVMSNRILNIIDEAHHGQTKKMAVNRDAIFPNASNYLFTATGKSNMYAYYFPDNKADGFRNKFTMSDAKKCKITVPVLYLKTEKTYTVSKQVSIFADEVEQRLTSDYISTAGLFDVDNPNTDDYLGSGNKRVSKQVKKMLAEETYPEKIIHIASFMDKVKESLPFKPKAIVYVESIEAATKYIGEIQTHNKDNLYLGYRWGVDFSTVQDNCSALNPGIDQATDISANFEKIRTGDVENDKLIIDILFAVDKYQKGFDLPVLLSTFLDTNINEPARMNQIYTRTATKYPGKTIGYCVDLGFDDTNQLTYQQSLMLYDNQDDIKDSFIDGALMTELKATLATQFNDLRTILKLSPTNFTSGMILQQILNESDLKLRQKRQHAFFYTTKTIISNLSKIGSPLFFKPFMLEIKAISEAFAQFKLIYADASNPEHDKIIINIDRSFDSDVYITEDEIKTIISEVLVFLNEHNIKSMLDFNYANTHKDVSTADNDELLKRFNQELKRNTIEKTSNDLDGYLRKNHAELYALIKEMLAQMSDDRTLIYQTTVQNKLSDIEKQLANVQIEINERIQTLYNGNSFLFWSNSTAEDLFGAYGLKQPEFIDYMSKCVYAVLNIVLPQIDNNLSVSSKVQLAIEMLKDKNSADTFSFYLRDYQQSVGINEEFKAQIKNAPKSKEGELFFIRKDLFNQYLQNSLKQYYQHKYVPIVL